MPHYVYILYSEKLDKYYVGETGNVTERLRWHNEGKFDQSYTTQTNDWQLYWSIVCTDISVARKVEAHIKQMKSRKYYSDLKKYPDIGERLLKRYS